MAILPLAFRSHLQFNPTPAHRFKGFRPSLGCPRTRSSRRKVGSTPHSQLHTDLPDHIKAQIGAKRLKSG